MRRLILALACCLVLSGAARAEPYALLGASPVEGLSMIDVASVREAGPYRRAWAYLVPPEKKPQRVYLEASELEFDCARKRTRLVAGVRYDDKERALARTAKVDAWIPVVAGSPGAAMHRQICGGGFDPATLRGHGKSVHQYAAEMRPLLSRLPR